MDLLVNELCEVRVLLPSVSNCEHLAWRAVQLLVVLPISSEGRSW